MNYLRIVIIAMMFVLAQTAMAETSHFETATIKSVDVKNNTITVEFDNSGITRTFNFPDKINFIDNGVALVDKSAFKSGQPIKLEFETKRTNIGIPGRRPETKYVLKGMIVK